MALFDLKSLNSALDELQTERGISRESVIDALATALAELGVIPAEAARTIEQKATLEFVKLERVKKIEEETRHDLMAVVKALAEASGARIRGQREWAARWQRRR